MKCPFCRKDNDKVVDSRSAEDGQVIRRRRECLECSKRNTTYERIEEIPLRIIKKDGGREPYDRNKLLSGLLKACQKRPVPTADLEGIADEIEEETSQRASKEVPSKVVGEAVMNKLRDLDQVAYVRFASVYRDFKDVGQFLEELRPLLEKGADE